MKKINRKISLLLLLMMLVGTLPSYAQTEALDVSNWAKIEILDAERYGLYENRWYKEGFRQAISEEKIDLLIKNTEEKIKLVGKANPNFKRVEVGDRTSRGGYLRSLYNVLSKYDSDKSIAQDAIIYLNQLGIVKGNGKKLYLDRKINTEEAIVFAKRAIDSYYYKNNAGAKGLMWEAEKNGNKVYMLGSIHLGDSSIYPFSEKILDRFNLSDELFVEVDISNVEANEKILEKKMEEMQKKMFYKEGEKLKDKIGNELYAKLKKVMDKYEIEESTYENMKVWGVIPQVTTLKMMEDIMAGEKTEKPEEISDEELEKLIEEMEKAEKPTDYGIDMYFILKAKELNKPVVELESMEMQMELLFEMLFANPYEKLSLEEQKKALDKELESILNPAKNTEKKIEENKNLEEQIEEFQKSLKGMLDSWKNGNPEELKKILEESSDPNNSIDTLLGDRDKAMAKKISKLLDGEEKKTYFVVVGAAHYVSDGMVIDNLKDMGYKVKSLNK